jgi:predicted nucleotidyltransferase
MADEQIITAIKNYIYLLNNEGFKINRAFLYGSYATGKSNESSDIDLMLISESLDENDRQKKSRAWILTKKIDSRIEPYLVNYKRFDKDENSPLFEIVRREGLEIHF